jgi:hypothetical protein
MAPSPPTPTGACLPNPADPSGRARPSHRQEHFQTGVGPGNDVRIVGIGGGVHRIAPGSRNHTDVIFSVNETSGRQHHSQCGGFSAAHARTSAADIQQSTLGEHHVRKGFFVNELSGSFGSLRVEVERPLVKAHVVVVFADHLQCIMIAAGIHAFRAAFALCWIDEDAELAATLALLLKYGEVLGRHSPLIGHQLALRLIADLAQLLIEYGRLNDLTQDRSIRTLSDALHAADTVLGNEQGMSVEM